MNFNAEKVLSEFEESVKQCLSEIQAKIDEAELGGGGYDYWYNQGVTIYEVVTKLRSLKKQSAIEILEQEISDCKDNMNYYKARSEGHSVAPFDKRKYTLFIDAESTKLAYAEQQLKELESE